MKKDASISLNKKRIKYLLHSRFNPKVAKDNYTEKKKAN